MNTRNRKMLNVLLAVIAVVLLILWLQGFLTPLGTFLASIFLVISGIVVRMIPLKNK